jgi:hypothetical protein
MLTSWQLIFLLAPLFFVQKNYFCMAQVTLAPWVIGKKCKITCNGSKRLRLICRKGQQWCVSYTSLSKPGDFCGCCKSSIPSTTCAPTPKPSPRPLQFPPNQVDPRPTPKPLPFPPIQIDPQPTEFPPVMPPTNTSIPMCGETPFNCKGKSRQLLRLDFLSRLLDSRRINLIHC